jgi:hypothetical protein
MVRNSLQVTESLPSKPSGCMVAKHHKMCKLVNCSCPSNITSCLRAPGRATEEPSQTTEHTHAGRQVPYTYSIGASGRNA